MKKTVMGITLILLAIFVLLLSFLFLTVKAPFYLIILAAFGLLMAGLYEVGTGLKNLN